MRLENLMERLLTENAELQKRLLQSGGFSGSSINGNAATIRELRNVDEGGSTITSREQNAVGDVGQTTLSEGIVMRYAFEHVLWESPVYLRHENRNECDVSFSSTAQRSHAWSALAGYSLADVSVLSVVAMPLTAVDIPRGASYYTAPSVNKRAFGRPRRVREIEINRDDILKAWPAIHF